MSRLLGLLRIVVMTAFFTPLVTDAFIVAFRIPNVLRRLFGEGTLSVAVVPVLTEIESREGKGAGREFISSLFSVGVIVLGVLALLGVIAAPWIVRLITPGAGFSEVADKYELTINFMRMTFPYIFFIGLVALAMGVLNARKHFFAPAFAPVLLNTAMIVSVLVIGKYLGFTGWSLAIGVMIGGVLQLLLQVPFLKSSHAWPSWRPKFSHPGVRQVGKMMIPSLLGLSAVQMSVIVMTVLASFLPEGSISYLFYADRLIQLPLGVIAVSAGTAILPLLSDHAIQKNFSALCQAMIKSFRILSYVAIPAAVGLLILRVPIVRVLFERGEFTADKTAATAEAIYYYSFGLWAAASIRVVAPAFFSMKDMRTPAIGALVAFAIQAGAGWYLMGSMGHGGLALATSISLFANLGFLGIVFMKRHGEYISSQDVRGGVVSLIKISIASLVMGLFVEGIWALGGEYIVFQSWFIEVIALMLVIMLGVVFYTIVTRLFGCEEWHFIVSVLSRRAQRKRLKGVTPEGVA